MKIAITGATGLVGRALIAHFLSQDATIIAFSRHPSDTEKKLPAGTRCCAWAPDRPFDDVQALEGLDALIHLAGENVAARWTRARKRAIRESRVLGTLGLMRALRSLDKPPGVVVGASAIGYYGSRGDELIDEERSSGDGFLADVCRDWESAYAEVREMGVRLCLLRIGMVLARDGGALARMLPPFRMGLGGPLGPGTQWVSWIHILDLVRLICFCIEKKELAGAINVVAPTPLTQGQFARQLGMTLRRPALMPVPTLGLRWVLGEMSQILLASQRVIPRKALAKGFTFDWPDLRRALENLLGLA